MALAGELTMERVPSLLDGADALAAAGTLDLSAVSNVDSAGIALLLELTRRARARGTTLAFSGANQQVKRLVGFFGLESALQFT